MKAPETLINQDTANPWLAAVLPICQTSTFTFSNVAEMEARFSGKTDRPVYSRGDNPTVLELERKLAQLEGAEAARAVSSGMAAISGAVLAYVKPGDRIVCVRHIYPDAYKFMMKLLPRFGVTVDFIEGTDTQAVINALPGATLLYLESPTSFTFETQELAKLALAAKSAGVITVCDNSWATPLHQNPIRVGIDIVVHSSSKYISGHSDVVGGVIVASKERIAHFNDIAYPFLGAKFSPFEAWLLLRGLRTLPARMKSQWLATQHILDRLAKHPDVKKIYHPYVGVTAAESSLTAFSSLFAFELKAGLSPEKFCDALEVIKLGVSWGGHESLAIPASIVLKQTGGPNSLVAFQVSSQLVRIYVGLEGAEDLWTDLDDALKSAH